MPADGQVTGGPDRQSLIDAITARVWTDPQFGELLFSGDSDRALIMLFGEVPAALEGVEFRPQRADRFRARPNAAGGRDITVRPRAAGEPITAYTRVVRGVPELVLVLYTKRCRYQCTECRLPEASSLDLVSGDDIARQAGIGFDVLTAQRFGIRRVSIGNEGSPLDARTLLPEDLDALLARAAAWPGVEEIIIETRSEFATAEVLDRIVAAAAPARLTLKVGLESADDGIRNNVLRKRMDLGEFEASVHRMGERGIGLSCYVLLKAHPLHDDVAGRADALATCEYLTGLCRGAGVELELRINSMYMAAGTPWATWATEAGWVPPSVFDLAEVMCAAAGAGVPVFAGLSAEGLATEGGHYDSRPDYRQWAAELLDRFNETGNMSLLREAATFRARTPVPGPSWRPPGVLLYGDVQERLGPLPGSLISAPQTAPGGGGPPVVTAFAGFADPQTGVSGHGFGRGWSTTEAHAGAALEAYERLLTRAHPAPPGGASGSAVAFTREDAIRTAFCEAVERGAAAAWWQGCLAAPAVDLSTVDDTRIHSFIDGQRAARRKVWVLDITPGVIPVFIVFVQEPGQQFPVSGMACRPGKYQAIEAAVLEAAQAVCYAGQEQGKWPAAWEGPRFWEPGTGRAAWSAIPDGPDGASWRDLSARAGLAVTVHDLPQLCDGLAAVRVTIPGLRSIHQPGGYNRAPFPI
jgi:radical SAM enzyme (TIGR01210 family)